MIVTTAYNGGGPVSLSFSRTVARTEPCGDWNDNLARTGENEPFPEFRLRPSAEHRCRRRRSQ